MCDLLWVGRLTTKSFIAQFAEGTIRGLYRGIYLYLAMSQRDESGLIGARCQIDAFIEHQMEETTECGHIALGYLGEAVDLALTAEEEAEHTAYLSGDQRNRVALRRQLQPFGELVCLLVQLWVDIWRLDGLQHLLLVVARCCRQPA